MNQVLYWWPNLVGYFRIISTVIAFYYVFSDPFLSSIFYLIGQGFDAVDGVTARYFNQCSRFGAVLDMLTDRMSTAVLIIVLSHIYSAYWGFFAFLIVLDIVSHWFQMYSKLLLNKMSHKGSKNKMLNFYYTFPYALLVFCIGNEMFFVAAYLISFKSLVAFHSLLTITLYASFPIFALKQFMNVVQLWDSIGDIIEYDLQLYKKEKNTK